MPNVRRVSAGTRPLSEWTATDAVSFVLTDIDDTLTTDGQLHSDAYAALEELADDGVAVVPVTGRPAGWCDLIARFWPVAAVVGENGALYFRYDRTAHRMIRRFWAPPSDIERARQKLSALAPKILEEVPGAAISADQPYRVADLAIDYCEDVPPLAKDAAERVVAIFEGAGAVAKISSIHVNGWFGDFDKLTTTKKLFTEQFGIDLDRNSSQVAFIGDSPNDAPMFGFFENAVGVANINQFAHTLEASPTYVTNENSGAGFVEFARHLLASRRREANSKRA